MYIIIPITVNDHPYGKDYILRNNNNYLTDLGTKIIVSFSHLGSKLPPVLLLWLCILMGIFWSQFFQLFAFSIVIIVIFSSYNN